MNSEPFLEFLFFFIAIALALMGLVAWHYLRAVADEPQPLRTRAAMAAVGFVALGLHVALSLYINDTVLEQIGYVVCTYLVATPFFVVHQHDLTPKQ